MDEFKAANGVPESASSCHTALVGGYVVEGHVPAKAIVKLLAERPDAAGIALGGMPADAPGMGGDQAAWDAQPVMLILNDGQMVAYDFSS